MVNLVTILVHLIPSNSVVEFQRFPIPFFLFLPPPLYLAIAFSFSSHNGSFCSSPRINKPRIVCFSPQKGHLHDQ